MDRGGRASAMSSNAGDAGKPARELVEPPRCAHALDRDLRLIAHATRERRDDHGDGQEDHECQQLVRLGDREGVERLDEEEVVGEERQHRSVDRRPDAERHRREHHGQQKDHGQVRERA